MPTPNIRNTKRDFRLISEWATVTRTFSSSVVPTIYGQGFCAARKHDVSALLTCFSAHTWNNIPRRQLASAG